jgi:hypothetical protein
VAFEATLTQLATLKHSNPRAVQALDRATWSAKSASKTTGTKKGRHGLGGQKRVGVHFGGVNCELVGTSSTEKMKKWVEIRG